MEFSSPRTASPEMDHLYQKIWKESCCYSFALVETLIYSSLNFTLLPLLSRSLKARTSPDRCGEAL